MDVPKIPTPSGGYSGLVWSRRAGKKTGPKPTFTREDVINAALDIGVATFTLAEVARRIGVAPSAVYRVFDSRDELVQACLEYGATTMDWDTPKDLSWDEALRHWGHRIWGLCETYPGIDLMMLTFPGVYVQAQSAINGLVRLIVGQGFTQAEALRGFDTIADMVISTHIGVATMRATTEDGETALQTITSALSEDDVYRPADTFMDLDFLESKFDILFDGMRVARYRRRAAEGHDLSDEDAIVRRVATTPARGDATGESSAAPSKTTILVTPAGDPSAAAPAAPVPITFKSQENNAPLSGKTPCDEVLGRGVGGMAPARTTPPPEPVG